MLVASPRFRSQQCAGLVKGCRGRRRLASRPAPLRASFQRHGHVGHMLQAVADVLEETTILSNDFVRELLH